MKEKRVPHKMQDAKRIPAGAGKGWFRGLPCGIDSRKMEKPTRWEPPYRVRAATVRETTNAT
jgi:hypothetical protein